MRSLSRIAVLALVCGACGATGPGTAVTGLWGYEAGDLTDGVVLCSIAVPMTLTQSDSIIAGTFFGSYMSCSSPAGATSTVASGTVTGSVVLPTWSFSFQNSQEYNYGSAAGSVTGNTNVGTHLANQATFEGTTTMQVMIDGVPHTLTGTWIAKQE
jgi:hypothetical protein